MKSAPAHNVHSAKASGSVAPVKAGELTPARHAVVIEATRIRAPRLEGGDTFIHTIETHAEPMEFRVQRGWLENLADNTNAVLGRDLSIIQKLDLKLSSGELEKICDQAQMLVFMIERLRKKNFASQGQPSAPPTSSLSPNHTASPPDSASPARTETLPMKFPELTREGCWGFIQEWFAAGTTLQAFVARKGHDYKFIRNRLLKHFENEVRSHELGLSRAR